MFHYSERIPVILNPQTQNSPSLAEVEVNYNNVRNISPPNNLATGKQAGEILKNLGTSEKWFLGCPTYGCQAIHMPNKSFAQNRSRHQKCPTCDVNLFDKDGHPICYGILFDIVEQLQRLFSTPSNVQKIMWHALHVAQNDCISSVYDSTLYKLQREALAGDSKNIILNPNVDGYVKMYISQLSFLFCCMILSLVQSE